MAANSLASAGVTVTVTDQSFYISSGSKTVPIFFIATAEEKYQPGNTALAAGTMESNVIRTVTSLKQSIELYGIPRFLTDGSGRSLHGDARNEYGLFALNQFLTTGNYAYVVRADVDLNDNLSEARTRWDSKIQEAGYILENLINSYIQKYNLVNGLQSTDTGYKVSITSTELLSMVDTAMKTVWDKYLFDTLKSDFVDDHTTVPYLVYASGYSAPSTSNFIGLQGEVAKWVANGLGTVAGEWLANEAKTMLFTMATNFKYTTYFLNETTLGEDDASRRGAIVERLKASILHLMTIDAAAELYEYNIIACPGYPEVTPELGSLNISIDEEAFIIADLPFNLNPEQAGNWIGTTAANSYKGRSDIGVYYPHAMSTNLDGKTVFVPASCAAIRTYARSDDMSDVWFAVGGTRRGLVTGIDDVGYITGDIGFPTTFVPVALNKNQRGVLYNHSINPITNFPTRGILIWGQKTMYGSASSLDRINAVRCLQYIKRYVRKDSMPFVFEPNDKLTRDNLKSVLEGFLSNLVIKRALYDYAVQCDSSNNTPDRIDQNQLYADIAIKIVKTAEFIIIPIRVVNTGAQI